MVDRGHALLARNVEYVAGSVGTRHGYAGIQSLPGGIDNIFELYNWIGPFSQISSNYADSAVAMASSNGTTATLSVYNLNTTTSSGLMGAPSKVLATTAAGASIVGIGMRLYHTTFDAAQHGIDFGGVITAYSNAGAAAYIGAGFNNLFSGPSSATPTTSEPAAGLVTAGAHRVGYLVEFINGFTTRVSPDASTAFGAPAFAPIAVTAAGSKNLRLSFALNWDSGHAALAEIVAVSVVMTTTTNLNQYYVVPGSRTALASLGSTAAFTIDVSISDSDLSSQGIDATPYLYWLTQGANNTTTGGFKVRHMCLFGDRMAYLATQTDSKGNPVDAIYVSERNNYQAISADQHIIQLPGQRPITSMFRMGSVNYICGPNEIWSVADNGDVPASWPAPALVDGRHGTLSIHGVEVSPSGNYAWIIDQAGLFLFSGGPISALPISYYQSRTWNTVNWDARLCVKIRDDGGNKRVHVAVPINAPITVASNILTWDYTNGASAGAVMFSNDSVGAFVGGMDLVRNELLGQAPGSAGKVELWVASTTAGLLRRKTNDADARTFRAVFLDSTYIVQIAVSANIATVTFNAAHGLYTGQTVSVLTANGPSGAYVISVTGTTSLTFHTSGVADGIYTTGSALEPSIYQDCGVAISTEYQTCPLPGRGVTQGQIQMHHGFHARLTGSGTPALTLYAIDSGSGFACAAQSIAGTQDMLVLARVRNELAYLDIEQSVIGAHWKLSYLKWYFSEYLMQR